MKLFAQTRNAAWIALLVVSFWAVGARTTRAARTPASEVIAEELTLEQAIEKAMRWNPTMVLRRLTQESNEINYENAWAAMFLPSISFNLGTRADYSVGQLGGSAATMPNINGSKGNLDHGTPNGPYSSVSLGEYTLYNFGKDRDAFEAAKLTYDRSKQSLKETERNTRFTVTNQFYDMKTKQDLLDISKRTVDSAQAIMNLIKSRIAIGKAKESDLSSAENDLLTAKNNLLQDTTNYNVARWALNTTLGDTLDKQYVLKGKIEYKKIGMTLDTALKMYAETSPTMRDAKLALESARIGTRLARKNSLPLPKVVFSGVTVGQSFSSTQSTKIRTTTGATNGNLDVSAQLSFTIPLVGSGGLFGWRTRRLAEINEESAEINLRVAANGLDSTIRAAFADILQKEETIVNAEKIYKEAARIFENALANLQNSGGLNRLELRDAITNLRTSEQAYTTAIRDHYQAKVTLAGTLGVDELVEEEGKQQ